MKPELLERLRCPKTGQRLRLRDADANTAEIAEGWLDTEDGSQSYPITASIPRFVPQSNYADNFGMQWNHFRQTQLDSYSGCPVSAERFWGATGWSPQEMRGKWVLDVGCGAGRFAEIALSSGAHVVALDYSSAADACYANLKQHPNLHVIQGDVYALPFAPAAFSFVYSLGVLQHTPDVHAAFASLPPMLEPEGRLCVDYYEKSLRSVFHIRHVLRPITTRMSKGALFSTLQNSVPVLLPVSQALARVPGVGHLFKRLIPVANHFEGLPLSPQQLREWALLDTFDWLSPQYDQPQSEAVARRWMQQAHLRDIEVLRVGHLVTRGRK